MTTVTFDNEPRQSNFRPTARGFSAWLIRFGLVHTQTQATSLMILVTILCFLSAGVVLMRTNTNEQFNPGRHFVPVYEN